MYVIAFVNQKGGVGKSTLSLNVGAALAARGRRVILIDLDPQATSTAATLGPAERPGTAELLDHSSPQRPLLSALAVPAEPWGSRVVPTSYESLRRREAALSDDAQAGQFALLDALAAEEAEADYVLIDCPPNYGPLTSCALVAASGIVAPIQAAGESTHGLALLERRVAAARRVNADLKILGVVVIGFQGRLRVDREVMAFVSSDESRWTKSVRLTNGFKRAFIEQQPLHAVATGDSERAAVAEVNDIADMIETAATPTLAGAK